MRALSPDAGAFVDRHGRGPTSLTALRRLLSDVRRDGHASEDGEVTPGFASVAAPCHDYTGRPVAGVAVTSTAGSLSPPQREALTRAVPAAAGELTQRVGGHPPGR